MSPPKVWLVLSFALCFVFEATAQYQVNGNAVQTSCNCYTLTQAQNTQSGSVWNVNQIDLTQPFNFNFEVFLGNNNGGADGIVFGLQPNGTSVGTAGGGMGMGGVTPSIGVFLDTYQNTNHGDPAGDHISINQNGDIDHTTANNLAGPLVVPNMEDGNWHTLQVIWDPVAMNLTVFYDGSPAVAYTGNIVANVFGGNPNVFWGFTAATGGLNNLQQVCTTLQPNIFLPSNLACLVDTVFFTDSTNTFGAISGWDWDFGDGNSSNLQNPVHVYQNPGNYTVQLTVSDNSGCSDSTTINIDIVAVPDAGIDGTLDYCGVSGAQNLFDQLGGTPLTTGSWDGPSVLPGGHLATFDPAVHTAGTYEYIVVGGGSCFSDTSEVEVTLGVVPNAGTNGAPVTLCAGDPMMDLLNQLGGTPDAGGTWTGPSTLSNGQNGTFNPAVNTSGTYTYTVSSGTCPDSSASVQVTVTAIPDAGVSHVWSTCSAGGLVDLTDKLLGNPATGGIWLNPNNVPVAMPINPATAMQGTYTYIVGTVGCGDTSTLVVDITPPPFAGFGSDLTICGDYPPFGFQDTLSGGPDPGGTWYAPNGAVVTGQLFLPASSQSGQYIYVVDGTAPCDNDTAFLNIEVKPLPVPVFSVDQPDTCAPLTTTLHILNDSLSIAAWEWDFGDGNQSEEWAPEHLFFYSTCYDVSLAITTTDGCTDTTTVSNAVCARSSPHPDFNFIPERATVLNPVVNFLNNSENAVSYFWWFGDFANSQDYSPSYEFPAVGGEVEVCLEATTQHGCQDTVCYDVQIDPVEDVFIPNAFTPDGDGVNDTFYPNLTFDPTHYKFAIYDRWGELLFYSEDVGAPWDGTVNGNVVQMDAYVWTLEVESYWEGFRVLAGKVQVIR